MSSPPPQSTPTDTAAVKQPAPLNVGRSNTTKKANGWFGWGRRTSVDDDDDEDVPIPATPAAAAVAAVAQKAEVVEEYDPYR